MTEQEWLTSEDPAMMLRTYTSDDMPWPAGTPAPKVSDRKLRLFACACVRHVWHLLTDSQKVKVMFAEKEPWHQAALVGVHPEFLSQDALTNYTGAMSRNSCIHHAVNWLGAQNASEVADQAPAWLQRVMLFQTQVALLRDIVGNPYRPVAHPFLGSPHLLGGTVLTLARVAYEDRPGRKCKRCKGRTTLQERNPWIDDSMASVQTYLVKCPDCHGTGRVEDGTLDPLTLAALADALEEAGCQHDPILAHLRSPGPHVRGCWVIDLILGNN